MTKKLIRRKRDIATADTLYILTRELEKALGIGDPEETYTWKELLRLVALAQRQLSEIRVIVQ